VLNYVIPVELTMTDDVFLLFITIFQSLESEVVESCMVWSPRQDFENKNSVKSGKEPDDTH
jgi:hypothetical protein